MGGATQALQAIMPEDTAVVDPARRVFELSASQIGRRIDARGKGRGAGRRLHRPQRPRGHGPGPGGLGGGAAPELMTAGTVEEFQDAGKVHLLAALDKLNRPMDVALVREYLEPQEVYEKRPPRKRRGSARRDNVSDSARIALYAV